jgi:probable F420-dependent oxidoreductase
MRYASLGKYSNGPAAVELAQAAEAAGFDSIWTVEHVVVPAQYQSKYPYSPSGKMGSGLEDFPIPDPLIWLAYIASATRTIKLGTAILILPQRHPVVTAKAVATLDHLAGGGRVLLGIGVGWLAEELATLGVPFEDRGPRTDKYVAAMRTLWSQERASFKGRFVSFNEVFCRPLPAAGRIPIIVSGDTKVLSRAGADDREQDAGDEETGPAHDNQGLREVLRDRAGQDGHPSGRRPRPQGHRAGLPRAVHHGGRPHREPHPRPGRRPSR